MLIKIPMKTISHFSFHKKEHKQTPTCPVVVYHRVEHSGVSVKEVFPSLVLRQDMPLRQPRQASVLYCPECWHVRLMPDTSHVQDQPFLVSGQPFPIPVNRRRPHVIHVCYVRVILHGSDGICVHIRSVTTRKKITEKFYISMYLNISMCVYHPVSFLRHLNGTPHPMLLP